MTRRIMLISLLVIMIIINFALILLIVWAIISPGKIRKYKGNNSLSEKFVMDINGEKNGFFINSVDINNPVLLLVSSGPGTDDYFLTSKYKNMKIEEHFTIVYWDYRGMGIAYNKNIDINNITMPNLVNDAHSVTNYLKERFNKDKIYIMGFSGGTKIALNTVKEYPSDYYAYIGMAQVVTNSSENDTIMYNFMKDVFTKNNKKLKRKELEQVVNHLDNDSVKCNNWGKFVKLLHDAGGGTILGKSEKDSITLPIIFSKCYTIKEKFNYIKGLKLYKSIQLESNEYDYRESISKLDIPAYFISGEYDYNCPWELVEDYYNKLDAPKKGFYKITNSAHSPLWENYNETINALLKIKEETINE